MNDTEKTQLAEEIDARVKALRQTGIDDVGLFVAMSDHMPTFKRLMDATSPGELDRLAARFPHLHDYAVLLTSIAGAIADGTIEVPR
jgi:hypothetical protein